MLSCLTSLFNQHKVDYLNKTVLQVWADGRKPAKRTLRRWSNVGRSRGLKRHLQRLFPRRPTWTPRGPQPLRCLPRAIPRLSVRRPVSPLAAAMTSVCREDPVLSSHGGGLSPAHLAGTAVSPYITVPQIIRCTQRHTHKATGSRFLTAS